jgi:hypothetical protein
VALCVCVLSTGVYNMSFLSIRVGGSSMIKLFHPKDKDLNLFVGLMRKGGAR